MWSSLVEVRVRLSCEGGSLLVGLTKSDFMGSCSTSSLVDSVILLVSADSLVFI